MIEPGPSVLIVEDDTQTRRFLKAGLSGRGWGIHEAESDAKGLTQVKAEPPDLAIVDLGLPDMDGVSLVRSLRLIRICPYSSSQCLARNGTRSRHWIPGPTTI
jgi:two-component system KDP operon response regulator KdpE